MFLKGSARISPTALYTGEMWLRHGRSFPELRVPAGALAYQALQPAMASSRWLGGPTLQDFLLARHDLIDAHVRSQVVDHGVHCVVELASGLSPRGMRFVREMGANLCYIEADLPGMAATKRQRLEDHLKLHPNHCVVDVDVFAPDGALSLLTLFELIPRGQKVCVVTEGLLNYFSREQVETLARLLGEQLQSRPGSSYVSDIHLQATNQGPLAEGFRNLLGAFVQGRVHFHYRDEQDLVDAFRLLDLQAHLLRPSEQAGQFESCRSKWADLVHILVATPGGSDNPA
ncbi:MAG: class I SAM-dependent methyltransferase [Limnobacter sp.]|nr:class I SAM-dependent methyltransferase [Limnobacter sp.]